MNYALDTTILIDLEAGNPHARATVERLLSSGHVGVHPVCVWELLAGVRSAAALKAAQAVIVPFEVLAVRNSDLIEMTETFGKLKLSHGVGWADCLIGMTCRRLGVTLVTNNSADFAAIPRVKVLRPYL